MQVVVVLATPPAMPVGLCQPFLEALQACPGIMGQVLQPASLRCGHLPIPG